MMLPLHGICYRTLSYDRTVCMVMPLNIIVCWSRRLWIWMRFQAPGGMFWFDQKLQEAYYLGIRETHERYQ